MSDLLDNLRRLYRVMRAAYVLEDRRISVWKDDIDAIEAAIEEIEKMENE